MNDTFNRIRYVGRRSFNERVWRFDVAQNLVGYARFHVYSNFTSTSKQMYVHVCVCVNVGGWVGGGGSSSQCLMCQPWCQA